MSSRNLKPAEVAARLGCAICTLERWRCQGKGPRYIKTTPGQSGRILYPEHELEKWERIRAKGGER